MEKTEQSESGEWRTQRPCTRATRWVIVLAAGAFVVSGLMPWFKGGEAVNPMLLIVPAFMAGVMLMYATPTITLAADSRGVRASGYVSGDVNYLWNEITAIEAVAAPREKRTPAFFHLIGGVNFRDPERFNIGGSFVRIYTARESVSVSCPDPEAFMKIARRCRPDLGWAEPSAAEPHGDHLTPRRSEEAGQVSGVQGSPAIGERVWLTSMAGGDARERERRLALYAPLLFLPTALVLFVGHRWITGQIFMALWFANLALMILLYRWTLYSTLQVQADGLTFFIMPRSWARYQWASITSIRLKRAEEFSWFDRYLRFLIPGRRSYFGGDALVVSTRYGQHVHSVREAESVLREIARQHPTLVEGGRDGLQ